MLGPGSLIASRYEILSALGAGGMGVVYKAHDRVLDETVALKVLRSDLPLDPDREKRFRSEIKLAWKVRHKNVCGIHEYGEDGDWRYISMELVEGNDLKQALRDHGPLPWDQAFDVAIQTTEGLQAIHDVGIIHRDLKTANLIRDARGLVRLMDFGIAKQWTAGAGITQAGQVVGSPEYMSPEQVWGHALDFRSDLYSLGVVVFELFTGRVPFKGDTPVSVMLKHLHEVPPLESADAFGLPPALLPVLRKALAKDVAGRPESARELAGELRAAQAASLAAKRPQAEARLPAPSTGAAPTAAPPAQGAALAALRPADGPPRRNPEPRLLIPPLLRALRHDDRGIRAAAAEALGRMGPEAASALGALVKALTDPWPGARVQAARALGKLGPEAKGAIASLSEALADPDERVRAAVANTITQLAAPSEPIGHPLPDPPGRPLPEAPSPPPPEPPRQPAPEAPVEEYRRAPAEIGQAPTEDPRDAATQIREGPVHKPASPRAAGGTNASSPSFFSQVERVRLEEPPRRPRVLSRRVRRRLLALSRTPVFLTMLGVGATAYLLAWWMRLPNQPSAGSFPSAPPVGESSLPPPTLAPVPTPATTPSISQAAPGSPSAVATPSPVPPRATKAPSTPSTGAPTVSPESPIAASSTPSPPEPPAVAPLETPAPTPAPPETQPPAPDVHPGDLVRLDEPGVVAPRPRVKARPAYPDLAQRLQEQGDVVLELLVDEKGTVAEIRVLSGPKTLAESTRAGALKWTFRPATKDGVPVKVWIRETVSYRLQ